MASFLLISFILSHVSSGALSSPPPTTTTPITLTAIPTSTTHIAQPTATSAITPPVEKTKAQTPTKLNLNSTNIPPSDPCNFTALQLLTYPAVRKCADNLPYLDDEIAPIDLRYHNNAQHMKLLEALYAFAEIVQDSLDAPDAEIPQELVDRGWKPHELKVNWRDELLRINATNYTRAFDYHHDAWKVFNSFYDGHTVYLQTAGFPFFHVFPFRFKVKAEWNTKRKRYEMVVRLGENKNMQEYNEFDQIPEKIDRKEHLDKPVKSINGLQAVKFIQKEGDAFGNYKDRGVRFNNMVLRSALYWPGYEQSLVQFGRREEDGMEIVFEDGTKLRTVYTFIANTRVGSTMQLLASSMKPTRFNQKLFDFLLLNQNRFNITDNTTTTTTTSKPANPVGRSVDDLAQSKPTGDHTHNTFNQIREWMDMSRRQLEQFPEDTSPESIKPPQPREFSAWPSPAEFILGFTHSEIGPFTSLKQLFYTDYGSVVGALFLIEGVPVVKYTSFQEANEYEGDSFVAQTLNLFREASKLGEQVNSTRVVVDLSGNPGGRLDLAYTILSMLIEDFDTHKKLCGPVDIPLSGGAYYWLETFNFTNQTVQATFTSEGEILEYLDDLNLTAEFITFLDDDFGKQVVKYFLSPHLAPEFANATLPEKNRIITQARMALLNIYRDPTGWYPFTAMGGLDTENYQPFTTHLLNKVIPVRQGGVTRNHTQWFIPRYCAEIPLSGPTSERAKITKFFEEVVVFTDGRCASACSAIVTQMLGAKKGKVVSAGGRLGFPMDTSSFRGGNVQSSDQWMNDYWMRLLLGTVFLWEKTQDDEGDNLPLPPVDSTNVYINFADGYTNYAGNRSLPIEFYRKPADVHWWVWPLFGLPHTGRNVFNAWHVIPPEDMKLWKQIYEKLATGHYEFV